MNAREKKQLVRDWQEYAKRHCPHVPPGSHILIVPSDDGTQCAIVHGETMAQLVALTLKPGMTFQDVETVFSEVWPDSQVKAPAYW